LKRILMGLLLASTLMLGVWGCAKLPSISTSELSKQTTAPSSSISTSAATITTLAPPSIGKAQEVTFNISKPSDSLDLVIFLTNGQTLDLDWKFVTSSDIGITFMFTTPEGMEMDTDSQPINLPGHPLYDPSLPTKEIKAAVGSHVIIDVGQNKYCDQGYYTMVFSGGSAQPGTLYLRYTFDSTTK